eukprot:Phypoly_transcript_02116.p1 GENE.Phypoly_transcript_02116~~Phypoly_transcript_02116.p1  ORF type:complete len:954 (+),score=114.83 Phypoly_transcript_02116:59-2920(+)
MYQELLVKQLKTIFPLEQTHVNSKKYLNVKYPGSGAYLELDVWIPNLNLGFEFQDAYHYVSTWYSQKPKQLIESLDSEKRLLVKQKGLDLIVVPCWWDGMETSLISAIHFKRPDLLEDLHCSIPLNPPREFFEDGPIPAVGELMLASFPTDPLFIESFVPRYWWMGEKYDGVRFFWNNSTTTAFTRSGKEISLALQAVNLFPGIPVDGEFWFGRRMFSTSHALLSGVEFVPWHTTRMIAFDVPPKDGLNSNSFEQRYAHLLTHLCTDNPMIILAQRVLCQKNTHLLAWVQNIIDDGGEGVILRQKESKYVGGRTSLLLKIKSCAGDKEGIVVEASSQSILLELPNGITFQVSRDDVHVPKLEVGDIVSFSYDSYGRGHAPVNPKVYRIRTDLSWEDVCRNYASERMHLNAHLQVSGFATESRKEMSTNSMRSYMEYLAAQSKKDPLLPDTWYNFPYENVLPFKSVINQHKGYSNTVQKIFPDIQFDINLFQRTSWSPIENRRKFFENYAKSLGFDFQDKEMWYKQPIERIMSFKGADRVISYHEDNIPKALCDLFPNIGLLNSKFKTQWNFIGNRKKFFEKYAKENGFDPLNPEEWYRQPRKRILATENAGDVMSFHKDRVSQAIFDIFPNIGFDKATYQAGILWHSAKERRRFFMDFANEKKFDPLHANNWYSPATNEIMDRKGAHTVLSYHKNSLSTALLELFPEIGLHKSKLLSLSTRHDSQHRRSILEQYAHENNFDPLNPNNWYSSKAISFLKGSLIVKTFYQGSAAKALTDLFPHMKLDKSRFHAFASWSDARKRRDFFLDYAKDHGFDATNPANWYTQPRERIMSKKGAASVLYHHQNTVAQALLDLFPDIGLEKSKFWAKSLQNRRQFFVNFAESHRFDPLTPSQWYTVPAEKIMAVENAESVIYYHKNSLAQALLDIFPNIGIDKSTLLIQWQIRTRVRKHSKL